MKFKLVKLERFKGNRASIYSVFIEEEQTTLFDKFIEENLDNYNKELVFIRNRLIAMAKTTGAREQYFKPNEGNLGDGVSALFDLPNSKLRLYCIRYGSCAVILGSGGFKPKGIKALQENEKLKKENELLRRISSAISKAIRHGDVKWSSDGYELTGDLIFSDTDYE